MTLSTPGFALLLAVLPAGAQESPPRAARSVHLWWTAPEGTVFTNEMSVEESTRGSYFMACGWSAGYFGIQELGKRGDKVVLFSVWDRHKGDDADAVPLEQRVEVLHQDPEAKVSRFGGEGTGGKCMYRYPWKIGERCRFLVTAKVEGEKTAYAGWFYRNDRKAWVHLVTFRTRTGGSRLKGYYSFVEDFRRDGKSPLERRAARYGNGWVRDAEGTWVPLTRATFTADRTPLDTIDASVSEEGFRLATGGETKQTTKLRARISLPAVPEDPPDLPAGAVGKP